MRYAKWIYGNLPTFIQKNRKFKITLRRATRDKINKKNIIKDAFESKVGKENRKPTHSGTECFRK